MAATQINFEDAEVGTLVAALVDRDLGNGGFEILTVRGCVLRVESDYLSIGDEDESQIVLRSEIVELRSLSF